MSNWWLVVGFIGFLLHTIGSCMIEERPETAGPFISAGFGIFAAVTIMVLGYVIGNSQ